ncbi:hypothetical protein, partial [Frisingicoccus sp.]|uniref:hypothetical protein n=1 Tax=Frisingicoccus sp. TaxID=1918627 RepID=UPI00399A9016
MKKWINLKWNKESALIIVLAGILCLVVVWPTSGKTSESSGYSLSGSGTGGGSGAAGGTSSDSAETALNLYVENQEQRLKSILEQMDG